MWGSAGYRGREKLKRSDKRGLGILRWKLLSATQRGGVLSAVLQQQSRNGVLAVLTLLPEEAGMTLHRIQHRQEYEPRGSMFAYLSTCSPICMRVHADLHAGACWCTPPREPGWPPARDPELSDSLGPTCGRGTNTADWGQLGLRCGSEAFGPPPCCPFLWLQTRQCCHACPVHWC